MILVRLELDTLIGCMFVCMCIHLRIMYVCMYVYTYELLYIYACMYE